MTNTSFNSEGVQFVWDSTSIQLWLSCPYKYYLVMVEGWRSARPSVNLLFGKHYATALEHFHKHRTLGVPFDDAIDLIIHEALIDTWDAEKGEPVPFLDNAKTRENLIRTIIWYFEQFRDDPMETLIFDGKPAVEFSFALPVDNDIIFSGHYDRLVTFQGEPFGQDQKTTGSTISSYFFDNFSPDIQFTMYTFAGRNIFNIPLRGIVVDAAQIAVGFSRFERHPVYRTESQLNEWYDDTMSHILNAQRATKERNFPMRQTSCGMYGGCEFRKICSKSPEVRLNFLKGDYEKRVWDPLQRR